MKQTIIMIWNVTLLLFFCTVPAFAGLQLINSSNSNSKSIVKEVTVVKIVSLDNRAKQKGLDLYNAFIKELEGNSDGIVVINPENNEKNNIPDDVCVWLRFSNEFGKMIANVRSKTPGDEGKNNLTLEFESLDKTAKAMKDFVLQTSPLVIQKDIKIEAPEKQVSLTVWLDRKTQEYKADEPVIVNYQVNRDGYFSLYAFTENGVIRVFPNDKQRFNFTESGGIRKTSINASKLPGKYTLKAVFTLAPSNIDQEGVAFKSLGSIGAMQVIPTSTPCYFADLDFSRFYHLPKNRYDEKTIDYITKP